MAGRDEDRGDVMGGWGQEVSLASACVRRWKGGYAVRQQRIICRPREKQRKLGRREAGEVCVRGQAANGRRAKRGGWVRGSA